MYYTWHDHCLHCAYIWFLCWAAVLHSTVLILIEKVTLSIKICKHTTKYVCTSCNHIHWLIKLLFWWLWWCFYLAPLKLERLYHMFVSLHRQFNKTTEPKAIRMNFVYRSRHCLSARALGSRVIYPTSNKQIYYIHHKTYILKVLKHTELRFWNLYIWSHRGLSPTILNFQPVLAGHLSRTASFT